MSTGEQELERLAEKATEYGLNNHKQECPACGECFSYSYLAAAYIAGYQAHQSETELLRKRVEKLREALEYIEDASGSCLLSHRDCCCIKEADIESLSRNALRADDKASDGRE